ncbi:MAG: HXXEE domain-containing protein [Chlamydiales bacterium]
MEFLYKNWAKLSLLIALAVVICLRNISSIPLFWIWIQFPIYLVHEFEEHVWPGKFKNFVNQQLFHSSVKDVPLNDAAVFWINILVIWILFPLAAIFAQTVDPTIGGFLPIFSLVNATTHIGAFLAKRSYNPGLAASLILNYPLGIYALIVLARNGDLSYLTASLFLVLSLLIHFVIMIYAVRVYQNSGPKK